MERKIKAIQTTYLVKVNTEIVSRFPSLKDARTYVKGLVINDDISVVNIIKQTLSECIVDVYETKMTKVLIATELDDGLS